MTNELADIEFRKAMVALAHWRSMHPDAEPKDEPSEVAEQRLFVMNRLSSLMEGDIDPWLGRRIMVLIRKSTRYIVYLDDTLEIQWWWTQRLNSEEGLSIIQASVARLSCASEFLLDVNNDLRQRHFEKCIPLLRGEKYNSAGKSNDAEEQHRKEYLEKAKGVRSLIAESMAMVLNGVRTAECKTVQAIAEQQILIEKDKMCRGAFFWQFFVTVLCLASASIAIWLLSGPSRSAFWNEIATLASVATAGAFGALVSTMTRTQQLALEPELGRRGLRAEALSRASIGAGAAILTYFAFESGLIVKAALSTDDTIQEATRFFLCLAAGGSERILPSLVGRAEGLMSLSNQTKTEHKKIGEERT